MKEIMWQYLERDIVCVERIGMQHDDKHVVAAQFIVPILSSMAPSNGYQLCMCWVVIL